MIKLSTLLLHSLEALEEFEKNKDIQKLWQYGKSRSAILAAAYMKNKGITYKEYIDRKTISFIKVFLLQLMTTGNLNELFYYYCEKLPKTLPKSIGGQLRYRNTIDRQIFIDQMIGLIGILKSEGV